MRLLLIIMGYMLKFDLDFWKKIVLMYNVQLQLPSLQKKFGDGFWRYV